jgi:hypothetical protein
MHNQKNLQADNTQQALFLHPSLFLNLPACKLFFCLIFPETYANNSSAGFKLKRSMFTGFN